MDADHCLTLPFVAGIDKRPDGSFGIRYQVNPGGLYPTSIPTDKTDLVGTLTDAISVSLDDWPTYTDTQLEEDIAAQWVNHLPAPPEPDPVAERRAALQAEIDAIDAQLAELPDAGSEPTSSA
jgi:hypothetical protein